MLIQAIFLLKSLVFKTVSVPATTTHNTMHVLVVHTHFIEDEEEDISQLSTFVSETFRTFAPKVTTD